MMEYIVFWTVLIFVFLVSFRVLQALDVQKYFKPNKNREIYATYVLVGLISGYLVASLVLKIIELFPWNQQFIIF